MMCRIIKSGGKIVVAICDSELLGQKYKEGEIVLDLDKYRSFYNGFEINESDGKILEKILKEIKEATLINVVGKRSVELLKKEGHNISNVKAIAGIPHLQIYKI